MTTVWIEVKGADGSTYEVGMEQIGVSTEGVPRLAQHVMVYSDGDVVSLSNSLSVVQHRAPNATVASVEASSSDAQLLPANDHRHAVFLHNMADTAMYVKLGAGAASDSFSFMVQPGETYEPTSPTVFLGIYSAVWDLTAEDEEPTGMVMITELT